MNFQRGRSREDPEINLIPMIDVLLVILIFLMITTTYSKFAELRINLPQAEGKKSEDRSDVINVVVDADGRYLINNNLVVFDTAETFSQHLKSAAGRNKDPVIVISADANATHQSVVNIMEAARFAGYTHITFTIQTRPNSY